MTKIHNKTLKEFNELCMQCLDKREPMGDKLLCTLESHCGEMKDFIAKAISEAVEEERQFILNILKGIDIADEQMGNKGGGTKAIRLAIKSRI